LRRQALQVGRSGDGDGPGEGAATQFADGAIDGANGPAEQIREYTDHRQRHGHQQQRLPQKVLLGALCGALQAGQLAIDLLSDAIRNLGCLVGELWKGVDDIGHLLRIGSRQPQFGRQLLGRRLQGTRIGLRLLVEGQGEQLVDGGDEAVVAARVAIEHLVIADDLIQARLALERVQFLEHALIVARALHAVHDQFLAAHAEAVHLHGAVDDGKQQRRGHDGETDEHQST